MEKEFVFNTFKFKYTLIKLRITVSKKLHSAVVIQNVHLCEIKIKKNTFKL